MNSNDGAKANPSELCRLLARFVLCHPDGDKMSQAFMKLHFSDDHEALEKALERRRLEGVLSSWFREETALSIVRNRLASERPAEAIYFVVTSPEFAYQR